MTHILNPTINPEPVPQNIKKTKQNSYHSRFSSRLFFALFSWDDRAGGEEKGCYYHTWVGNLGKCLYSTIKSLNVNLSATSVFREEIVD